MIEIVRFPGDGYSRVQYEISRIFPSNSSVPVFTDRILSPRTFTVFYTSAQINGNEQFALQKIVGGLVEMFDTG